MKNQKLDIHKLIKVSKKSNKSIRFQMKFKKLWMNLSINASKLQNNNNNINNQL